jgi:hypothetical protein
VNHEPGLIIDANWIVFGAAHDSIGLYANTDKNSDDYPIAVATNYGQEHDARGITAPYQRLRLVTDGVVDVSVTADGMATDSIAYTLRFFRQPKSGSGQLRPTGRWTSLTIASGGMSDRFSVVPASLARSVRDLSKWAVYRGTYKVALVADSVYEICRIPCLMPDRVLLKPSARATKRY